MPNGRIDFEFDFEKMYGMPFDKMRRREKDIVLINLAYQSCKRTRFVPWLEKVALAASIIIPAIIASLIWLFKMHMTF